MRLPVRGPFHLEATVRLLQRRPANRIDAWDGSRYWRVLRVGRTPVVCSVRNEGSLDEPRLELETSAPAAAGIGRLLSRILGLDCDPSFDLPQVGQPKLRAIGRALRGARPPRFPSLFESFCRVVPYQQVSLDAGGAVAGRLVERFGQRVGDLWGFPEAAEVLAASPEDFAGIGLSRTKVATLQNVARLLASGELREDELERMSTEAALRRLDALPGVGPWTAALVLLRGLRRMDVFPAADAGVQRGLRRILGDGAAIEPLVERLGERRGYLYFYVLGAQLLERGLIHSA
ncbi:MAG TPA: AlkA N-terminal domain-containing protein [Myxococcales bacterium]|jgi:DNA-3-methyladenine glycosylase II